MCCVSPLSCPRDLKFRLSLLDGILKKNDLISHFGRGVFIETQPDTRGINFTSSLRLIYHNYTQATNLICLSQLCTEYQLIYHNHAQATRRAYLLLGWFPEDTLVSVTALASLWGGISATATLTRVNRLHKLSMLTKVSCTVASHR